MQVDFSEALPCEFCDECGGKETYRNQIALPIGNSIRYIDRCIYKMVAGLNAAGERTVASCCGHNQITGVINMADGRALVIFPTMKEANKFLTAQAMEYEQNKGTYGYA